MTVPILLIYHNDIASSIHNEIRDNLFITEKETLFQDQTKAQAVNPTQKSIQLLQYLFIPFHFFY